MSHESRTSYHFLTLTRDIFTERDDDGRPSDDRTWIRVVEVHADQCDWSDNCFTPKNDDDLLEVIWRFGQNDFQPRVAPSLSVDDLVILDDANGRRYYRVDACGFVRVERHELKKAERLIVEFAGADIRSAKALQYEEAERYMHANGRDEEDIEKFRGQCAKLG